MTPEYSQDSPEYYQSDNNNTPNQGADTQSKYSLEQTAFYDASTSHEHPPLDHDTIPLDDQEELYTTADIMKALSEPSLTEQGKDSDTASNANHYQSMEAYLKDGYEWGIEDSELGSKTVCLKNEGRNVAFILSQALSSSVGSPIPIEVSARYQRGAKRIEIDDIILDHQEGPSTDCTLYIDGEMFEDPQLVETLRAYEDELRRGKITKEQYFDLVSYDTRRPEIVAAIMRDLNGAVFDEQETQQFYESLVADEGQYKIWPRQLAKTFELDD